MVENAGNSADTGEKDGKGKKKLRILLRTFGCQMNVRDTQIVLKMLEEQGYRRVSSPEQADIVLFNTCSVRQHAEQRVWSRLGRLNGKQIIGVLGCMAQAYQDKIFRRFGQVSLVCGPANIYDLPRALTKVIAERSQLLLVNNQVRPLRQDYHRGVTSHQAFVSIMYGCNNFCSYCIVPYVRGREISRPFKHILAEVKDLAGRGVKEITLLGQNVNSYGRNLKPKINFVQLLQKLNRVKDIELINFMTSHPKDAGRELFQAMRDLPKMAKHLHLPLQSGSDKILKLMHRGYTFKEYLSLVNQLRRIIPGCLLTTDIIVGFPTETQVDFKQTYQAMQKIKFNQAFIFKYSPRPKTQAAQFPDDVPDEQKQRRNQALLKLQEEIELKLGRS